MLSGEAGSRVGDDVGVIGGISEPRVIGIAGVAGVDEQNAPDFRALDWRWAVPPVARQPQ